MHTKSFIVLMYITIITIGAIYVPQPLLPELSYYFRTDMNTVSLVISVVLLPLAIVPVIYGYILEFVTPRKLILLSLIFLSFISFFICLSSNIYILIALRFIEGFFISAMLTSIMTYISLSAKNEKVSLYMSYYIAVTIMGGFSGRLISAIIANYSSWRYSFYFTMLTFVVGAILVFIFIELIKIDSLNPPKFSYFFRKYYDVVKEKLYFFVYVAVFCMFFVFAAITNFLPFRIESIDKNSSLVVIGVSYSGYLMGIFVSFLSTKFIKIFGSEIRAILVGFLIYMMSIFILNVPSFYTVFIGMFVLCGGMFLIHSIASGYLNKLAKDKKGIVNGVYVASYYCGGVLGSYLPGFIYKHFGWFSFTFSLLIVLIIGFFSVFQFGKL